MLEVFSFVGDMKFMAARVAARVDACMARVAPPSPGRAVFVMTGEPWAHEKYDGLRATYGAAATTKEETSPALVDGVRGSHGLDAGLAVLDMLAAGEAAVFVGAFGSSLSVRIAQHRLRLGRPSYLYNELDVPAHDCAPVVEDWTIRWADNSTSFLVT